MFESILMYRGSPLWSPSRSPASRRRRGWSCRRPTVMWNPRAFHSGARLMNRDLFDQARSLERPMSPLCRAVGLAAVAAELNLQLDSLEPETAKAIERGAAALFLAGYGPRLTGSAASNRLREKNSERVARSALSKVRRSARLHKKSRAVAIAAN